MTASIQYKALQDGRNGNIFKLIRWIVVGIDRGVGWRRCIDMARSRGFRRKTRQLLTRDTVRGLSYLLHEYKMGDKVVIDIDPREHKGMPHRRFQGKVGLIESVGRRALRIRVRIGNKDKMVIARLAHVRPLTMHHNTAPSVSNG